MHKEVKQLLKSRGGLIFTWSTPTMSIGQFQMRMSHHWPCSITVQMASCCSVIGASTVS